MLLRSVPLIFRRRPGRTTKKRADAPAPPAAALVLVEAAFDETAPTIRLTFDRAIDIDGLVGSQIVVDDGAMTGTRYEAVGEANLDGPDGVFIQLLEVGPAQNAGTVLTASAGTGIVAVDDGGTWAGATDVALPYP